MKKIISIFLFAGLFISATTAQEYLNDDAVLRMKNNVYKLASDSFEGREAGEMGEFLAAIYISEQFEKIGIPGYFNDCYFQDFEFSSGYEWKAENNTFNIKYNDGQIDELKVNEDYKSEVWGDQGTVQGDVCVTGNIAGSDKDKILEELKQKGATGKILLVNIGGMKDRVDDFITYSEQVDLAYKAGAIAVVFYNNIDNWTIDMDGPGNIRTPLAEIPVLWLSNNPERPFSEISSIELLVTRDTKKLYGKNVAAWIDNKAEQTIVIGAHYDHLGYGGANSRHEGPPEIHNGADDNASGVAGIIELAKWVKDNALTNKNYVFVAFSAEEKGLLGSKEFAGLEQINAESVFCMINFDMIGRIDEAGEQLSLLGAGSSEQWNMIFDKISEPGLNTKLSSRGISGSDQFHFYQADIPVIFFFTGIHNDYHKPTDDPELVNYNGMRDVVEFSIQLISTLDTLSEMTFTKVPMSSSSSRRTGKISLGIIPEHGADTDGMGVQDVIKGRPAAKAGLKKGDVIIKLGGDDIHDIMQYMRALNKIKEGDNVEVVVKRGEETLTFYVQF